MKFNSITLQIQNMGREETLSAIGEDALKAIKLKDGSPMIKVYSVGHVGEATANLVGFGSKIIKWFGEAITAFYHKLKVGTQLFNRHGETNSHSNRPPIGEVIAKTLRTIDGKLNAITIAWIYPEFKEKNFDVASVEMDSEVTLPEALSAGWEMTPDKMGEITGIAVGDSTQNDRPAFSGAVLQGAYQFMSLQGALQFMAGSKGDEIMDAKIPIIFEQVMEFISKNKYVLPSSLFSKEQIQADPAALELQKAGNENLHFQNQRLETEKAELKTKLDAADLAKVELEKQVLQSTSADEVKAFIEKRKFPGEKIQKFVEAKMKEFKPESKEELEKSANAAIDAAIADWKSLEELGLVILETDETGTIPKDGKKDQGKTTLTDEQKQLAEAQERLMGAAE